MTLTKDAAFWTRHAPRYAKAAIRDSAGYERTLARTADLIAGRATVLELGCGTGMTALRLAPVVESYLATDLAPGMIVQARSRLDQAPTDGLVFTVATARDLAAERLRFDAILGFSYLHLLRDLAETLSRIHTMLEPGGLFISKTPLVGEMSPLIRVAIRPAQWLGLAPHVLMLTEDTLRAALVAAGFEIVETARHGSGPKDARLFVFARKA
ncbi:MAG: class I SAM-dependent methyltransferase [Roseinatronobacter sp.]